MAAVALIPAVAVYGGWHSVERATTYLRSALGRHPYFSVQEIRVTGSHKVSNSQIVSLAGLRLGMNIWDVNPKMIEAKLNRHPWIRRKIVRREFPRRVLIRVEEWVAKAIIVLEKLYYVDSKGYVFKEVESGDDVNLLFISGLGHRGSVLTDSYARQKIAEVIRLNDLFTDSSVPLSEIHFLLEDGVVAYPVSKPVGFHMGWGEWPAKVRRLKRVWSEWKDREHRLTSLDLRFRGQVVVKVKGGA